MGVSESEEVGGRERAGGGLSLDHTRFFQSLKYCHKALDILIF